MEYIVYMAKKTFSVPSLKELVNKRLLDSPDEQWQFRVGMYLVLEDVLHEAGQYKGFSYLTLDDMKKSLNGETPGIVYGKVGSGDNTFPDESRRAYF